MLDHRTAAERLGDLAQLDIDAARAYSQALEEITDSAIHETISNFKADHHRHIADLSQAIRGLGGTPPTINPDLKGFLLEQFTNIRSQSGTEGALKAMQTNEKLTNKKYGDARGWDLAPDHHALIEKNYADEHRHLTYIETVLSTRAWEHPEARPSARPETGRQPGEYT